jgi:hypothetical protein
MNNICYNSGREKRVGTLSKIEFIDRTVTKHHPLHIWSIIGILTSVFFVAIWVFWGLGIRELIGLLLVHFLGWYFLIYPKHSDRSFVRGQDGWVAISKKF